jgi:hypothetical protein
MNSSPASAMRWPVRSFRTNFQRMTTTDGAEAEVCDVCGSTDLWWRNCKLLCRRCQSIVKSCADL